MYVKYFKLKGQPFGLNPDPRFFFNSHTHKRALSCLGYGLGQGQGFVVITGDPGTGKTTLMTALIHMLSQTNIITAKIINTQLQSDEMLRYVAAELGLEYEGISKVSLLKSIETYMETCRSNDQRIIVIIDEAQNLSDSAIEELRMLMNLVTGNDSLLQFVLLGQTRLKKQLNTDLFEPLRQRIVTSYHLEEFDEEETKAYVIQRLRTVGWVGEPGFSPGAFIAVYEQTHGIPAKINMLCGKALQRACINGSHEVTEQDVLNIIREMNDSFSDHEFSGSLVEGVIDAMVEKRTQQSLEKPVVVEPDELESVENTVEENLDEEIHIEEIIAEVDPIEEDLETIEVSNDEEIKHVDAESETNNELIPLVSDQITIDQALVESKSAQSDEDIDEEIESWLQQQKDRIKLSKENKNGSGVTSPLSLIDKEPESQFENLSRDDFERTLEDPPF